MGRRGRIAAIVALALVALWWLWPRQDAPVQATVATPPAPAAKERVVRPTLRAPREVAESQPAKTEVDPRAVVVCPLPDELAHADSATLVDTTWVGGHNGKVIDGALQLPAPRGEMDHGGAEPVARIYVDDPDETVKPVTVATRSGNKPGRTAIATEALPRSELLGRLRQVTLRFEGVGEATADVSWTRNGWTCNVGAIKLFGFVTGRVITKLGVDDARVVVTGCGSTARVDRDGGFFMEVAPEPCTVRAVRMDGAFLLRSPPVRVDPTSGVDVVLDLDLPSYEASGVGVGIEEHELGIRVSRVFPGTPAAAAGLRTGDVIVALDGADIVDLDSHGFVDLALGPPGTSVTYTVLRGDDEVDIEMVRTPMARPEM